MWSVHVWQGTGVAFKVRQVGPCVHATLPLGRYLVDYELAIGNLPGLVNPWVVTYVAERGG